MAAVGRWDVLLPPAAHSKQKSAHSISEFPRIANSARFQRHRGRATLTQDLLIENLRAIHRREPMGGGLGWPSLSSWKCEQLYWCSCQHMHEYGPLGMIYAHACKRPLNARNACDSGGASRRHGRLLQEVASARAATRVQLHSSSPSVLLCCCSPLCHSPPNCVRRAAAPTRSPRHRQLSQEAAMLSLTALSASYGRVAAPSVAGWGVTDRRTDGPAVPLRGSPPKSRTLR